jgi:hypothetical protein
MYDINCTHVEITVVINFIIKYITKGIIQLENYVHLYSILLASRINIISFTLSSILVVTNKHNSVSYVTVSA